MRSGRRAQHRASRLGLLVALALTAFAAPAGARPPHPRDAEPGDEIARHVDRLGLDAATRAAVGEILHEAGARRDALEAQRRAAREALRTLLASDAPPEEAVMRQAEVLGALDAEAQKNRLRAMMRIRALLTPAQRDELIRIREEQPDPWGRFHRCADDLRQRCPDARGPDALRCLATHWDALAPRCRDAVERLAPPSSD